MALLPTTVALVANGYIEDTAWLKAALKPFDHVIAVDGGMNYCEAAGITPHLIVGDFDSVDPQILARHANIPRQQFARDKNETDLELAVLAAHKLADQLVVFGALGLRTDHTLSNLHLLHRYKKSLCYLGPRERVFAFDGECTISCQPGQQISFIPINGPATGVTSQGLRWELTNVTLNEDYVSLSNECLGHTAYIRILDGHLICCLQLS